VYFDNLQLLYIHVWRYFAQSKESSFIILVKIRALFHTQKHTNYRFSEKKKYYKGLFSPEKKRSNILSASPTLLRYLYFGTTMNRGHGLTPTGSQAPHSCSLTTPQRDGGESWKDKSEKICRLRKRLLNR